MVVSAHGAMVNIPVIRNVSEIHVLLHVEKTTTVTHNSWQISVQLCNATLYS